MSIQLRGNSESTFSEDINLGSGNIQLNADGTVSFGGGDVNTDSSGRLLVGTSSAGTGAFASSLFAVQGVAGFPNVAGFMNLQRGEAATSITINEELGVIGFTDNAANVFAKVQGVADGTAGSGNYPGRLVFSTTADGAGSPTERMRITNSGQVRIGEEAGGNNYSFGVELSKNNNVLAVIDTNPGNGGSRVPFTIRTGTYSSSDTTSLYANFIRGDGTQRGKIRSNGATAVAYESGSDYRLKENVTPLVNATARLQQLKPYRFNFIDDGPERVVDGFFAHEVQELIPEAVGGVKDEVDAKGNPIYQGIDQAKLVPLLTAALQEAITKIETFEAANAALEARLTALEGGAS